MSPLFAAFAHPHWPNLALIAAQPLYVQVHLYAALAAFAIGAVQIFGPKGTIPHRILGWIWVVFMFTVAASSFTIRMINPGHLWFIHILSVATLITLPLAVYAARRHDVASHRRHMTGLFVGALIVAGVFTFLPGRLMWRIFFG